MTGCYILYLYNYVLQCHPGTLLLLKPVSKVHREDPPRQYSENPGSKVDFSPDLCMVKVHGQSTGHTLVTGSGSDKIIDTNNKYMPSHTHTRTWVREYSVRGRP